MLSLGSKSNKQGREKSVSKKLCLVVMPHIDAEVIRQAVAETGHDDIEILRFGVDDIDFDNEDNIYISVFGKLAKTQIGTLFGPSLLRNVRLGPFFLKSNWSHGLPTHRVSDLVDYPLTTPTQEPEIFTTNPGEYIKVDNPDTRTRFIADLPPDTEAIWFRNLTSGSKPVDVPTEEPGGPTDLGRLLEDNQT